MAYNFHGMQAAAIGMSSIGSLTAIPSAAQSFLDLANQGFPPPLPSALTIPGMNDAPLEFTTNKNQPPTVHESSDDSISDKRNERNDNRNRDRDSRDYDNGRSFRQRDRNDRRDRGRDKRDERSERDKRDDRRSNDNQDNINIASNLALSTNCNKVKNIMAPNIPASSLRPSIEPAANIWGMGLNYPMIGLGPIGPIMGELPIGTHLTHTPGYGAIGMGMISSDGSIMNTQILGQEQLMGNTASQIINGTLPSSPNQTTKEIIYCKNCTLFPPNSNAPRPTTRERPPGCRTIFVGGLPESISENIIKEIFERCGEITTLRLSKKNFCHIRFITESCVDAAIYLSGYRVRIGSNGDSPNTGRLHVDFAQARDDQYEWECKQRQLQREQRHRQRMEKEKQRAPLSPPPVIHYTDHEASNICEKIKQDDTFMKAVQVIITWLERGDCTKRNANTFYSMIQSTNSHVRRLVAEKSIYEEELQKAKELLKGRMQGLLIQFGQIERVFTAASHKKVWDHFTKAQRKNIEMWKKQSSEIKIIQLEETNLDGLMEMEVSDSEDEPQKKRSRGIFNINSESTEKMQTLKEENDSLRCQLEAYKNEVDLLKSETKTDLDGKEKQITMLQQTLKGMHEQLLQSKKQQFEDDEKIKDLKEKLNNAKTIFDNSRKHEDEDEREVITLDKDDDDISDEVSTKKADFNLSTISITQKDAKLMGLIAIFLHIHPFGASLDYVYYYLQKLETGLKITEVESLMQRFPQVFKQEVSGKYMERRWQFSKIFICD